MNPPTEQLVRDYLNRLSVAARTRLRPRDRQALLDQTRARIEAECGGLTRATAAQVRRTLAALGDPIALVENQHTDLAAPGSPTAASDQAGRAPGGALPGGAADGSRFASRASGSVRQIWPPPGIPATGYRPAWRPSPPAVMPPAAVPPNAGVHVPGGRSGAIAPAMLSVPAESPAPHEPAGTSGNPGPSSPIAPRGLPGPRGVPAQRGVGGPDGPGSSGGEPAPSSGAGPGAGRNSPSNGLFQKSQLPRPAPASDSQARASAARPDQPGPQESGQSPAQPDRASSERGKPAPDSPRASGPDRTGSRQPPDDDVPGVELSVEPTEPAEEEIGQNWLADAGAAMAGRLARFGSALLGIALRDRLETIAVLVLGLGGAILPPVWFVGALIAVTSRKWDLRDKWLGLATPVLAVFIGAALVVAFGGEHQSVGSYAFEAWLAAGRISRIAAILGAVYLLWRVYRGRRSPRLPPWSPQRRQG